MNYEKFALLIKEARIKKGLTQKELAEILYVTDRAVSKWERGKSLPDISMLKKISEVLDIDVKDLLEINRNAEDKKNIFNFKYIIMIITLVIILVIFYFLFIYNEKKEITVTNKNLKYILTYDNREIFYNNIDDFLIDGKSFQEKVKDNSFNFIDFMERLDNMHIYYDGGSVMYSYLDYKILKCNTIDGNNDIIIGNKYMEYQDNFCKNDKVNYSKCIYKDIFRVVNINNNYETDDLNYVFVTVDKFQDHNPIMVKIEKKFLNNIKSGNYYEFKFLYYYPNDYDIESEYDVFNYYELIGTSRVTDNDILNQASNTCESLIN